MGALLAFGFATRAQTIAARALSAATLPLLLATVYFTFSRGAWVAGAVGLAVAIAVDPRRLQLIAGAIVARGPLGARRPALVARGRPDANRCAPLRRVRRRPPARRVPDPARRRLGARRRALLARRAADRAFPAGAARVRRRARPRGGRRAPRRLRPLRRAGDARAEGLRRVHDHVGRDARGPAGAPLHVLGELSRRALARRLGRLRGSPAARLGAGHVRAVLERAPAAAAQGPRRAQPVPGGSRRAGADRASAPPPRPRRAARRRRARPRLSLRPGCACGLRGLPRACRRRLGLGDGVRSRLRRLRSWRLSARRRIGATTRRSSRRECGPAASSLRFCCWSSPSSESSASSALAASERALEKGKYDEAHSAGATRRATGGAGRPSRGDCSARLRRSRETQLQPPATTGRRSRRTAETGSSGTTSRRSAPAPSRGRRSPRRHVSTATPAQTSRRPAMFRVDPLANPEPLIKRVYCVRRLSRRGRPGRGGLDERDLRAGPSLSQELRLEEGRAGRVADRDRAPLRRRTAACARARRPSTSTPPTTATSRTTRSAGSSSPAPSANSRSVIAS